MHKNKIDQDLQLIKDLLIFARDLEWRMVVYGGYGLDFAVGKITRDHGDIDLVFYGQNDRYTAEQKITGYLTQKLESPTFKIEENDFQLVIDVHANRCVLNLYYVQTNQNPYVDLHQVVKKSGEIVVNDPALFPPPQEGSLSGINVEVQDQLAHKKDILSKGDIHSDKRKKDIDLINTLSSSN